MVVVEKVFVRSEIAYAILVSGEPTAQFLFARTTATTMEIVCKHNWAKNVAATMAGQDQVVQMLIVLV